MKQFGVFSGGSERTTDASDLDAERLISKGNAYEDAGRIEEAMWCYEEAVRLAPSLARAHLNRGNALLENGDSKEALAAYAVALDCNPEYAAAHYNMGNALLRSRQLEAALAAYGNAIVLKPDFVDAEVARGGVLNELGRCDDAIASCSKALEMGPDSVAVYVHLSDILRSHGRFDEALVGYRRALELEPESAEVHCYLGNVFQKLGRFDAALDSCRRALQIKPDLALAHNNMGVALKDLGLQLDDAAACYRKALEIDPFFADAHVNLGSVLKDLGQVDGALESYRRAVEIDPRLVEAHSTLLFIQNYKASHDAKESFSDATRYGELVARRACKARYWHNEPSCSRCLQVGFVSGDLRQHPVGNFFEGVLAALTSNSTGRLKLVVYSSCLDADEVTERIKANCDGWYSVVGISDETLAQRIREDQIDILIDLSGHTPNNRLPMFAWKPAPVQVSWLGYFATTGVAAIDYLFADSWTLPECEEVNFTEKIWRLPEMRLCFTPPDFDLEVSPLPACKNEYFTFACFNHLTKMSDDVVAVWARVLARVPGSRLFLKAKQLNEASVRQSVVERFAVHGIDAVRLILEGPASRREYLESYQRVDIALDPFPYPGGTTTVEALWMGVPVLTFAGGSFLSRQGVGFLMNAGLPEWIATDADDYVERAVSHSSNLSHLAVLRGRLRQQVLSSPVFDAPRFAQHFESALHGMWQLWCDSETGPGSSSGPSLPLVEGAVPRSCSDLMRLHIGGREVRAGWKILNVLDSEGVDFVGDVCDLSAFPDACCEKVYASHVMEHVEQRKFDCTLKGIYRILCKNGELYFSVPDLETLCRLFLSSELDMVQRLGVMQMMFGGQDDAYDFHRIGLTGEFMMYFLKLAGFSSIKKVESFGLFDDTSEYRFNGVPISLNLIAKK